MIEENICSAEIESVTSFGEMDVRFSTLMNTQGIDITMLNETLIDIYVKPSGNRATLSSFNVSQVNLTWSVTSFEGDLLKIKLTFENFAEISPLEE